MKKILFFLLLAAPLSAQVQLNKNVQIGGTSSSGATSVTGTAPIVVSPTTGNSVVSIGGSCQTITTSATPSFAFTTNCATLTLTSNVTSSTTSGAVTGLVYSVTLIQDGTGGWNFTPPASWVGWPSSINMTANGRTTVLLTALADGKMYVNVADISPVATAGNYNVGGTNITILASGQVTAIGPPFAVSMSCTAQGTFEIGYTTTNPNVCTLSYSYGTAASAGVTDSAAHSYTQTTAYTTYTGNYAYSASTTFTASATATNGQTAESPPQGFATAYCTFSGLSTGSAPAGSTASGSGSGNQCASETSTLSGGLGVLTSNGLGNTYVGQVFSFGSPAGNYVTIFATETGSGCNRNPWTFNGSSPVNGTTQAISSYTNILGGVQSNMCLYTFGPYSSAVTLTVAR